METIRKQINRLLDLKENLLTENMVIMCRSNMCIMNMCPFERNCKKITKKDWEDYLNGKDTEI